MPPFVQVLIADQDTKHAVSFEGTRSCLRATCTCSLGSAGYPCEHKLRVLGGHWSPSDVSDFLVAGDVPASASSDYEVVYDWTSGTKMSEWIADHEGSVHEYIWRESELLDIERRLREARLLTDPDERDFEVGCWETEAKDAKTALRSARRAARKSCARLVRVLNGISASGEPLALDLSRDARALAKWPTIATETIEDLEERFYGAEIVRARAADAGAGDDSGAAEQTIHASEQAPHPARTPPSQDLSGCGCVAGSLLAAAVFALWPFALLGAIIAWLLW